MAQVAIRPCFLVSDASVKESSQVYFRAILVWFLLSLAAVLNGIFRNAVITSHTSEYVGHVVSTATLCVLIFLLTWPMIRWIGPDSYGEAIMIGILWILMTVSFEFLAGHYLFGHSWDRLFADYNIIRGRVWVLVLITASVAPVCTARIRKLI